MIGKHFPYFAGHPSSAAKSTAPPWCEYSRQSRQSPWLAAHSQPCPTALSLLCSLEQVEGLWKDHALGLFLPSCTRLMRPAEESLLETGQHEPCRASHLESRGACLPLCIRFPLPHTEQDQRFPFAKSLNKDCGRGIKGKGDLKMKSSYFFNLVPEIYSVILPSE